MIPCAAQDTKLFSLDATVFLTAQSDGEGPRRATVVHRCMRDT